MTPLFASSSSSSSSDEPLAAVAAAASVHYVTASTARTLFQHDDTKPTIIRYDTIRYEMLF